MRSRRQEYTKRFEELTKQEIKNYNDSLLSTHRALEEFRGKLKDCVDLYAQQVAKLSSKIKFIEIENVDLKNKIGKLEKKLQSQINDFNNLEKKTIESDKKNVSFERRITEEIQRLNDDVFHVREDSINFKIIIERRVEDIFLEVQNCYIKTKKDNENLKEEILSLPSEAEKVKEELLIKSSETAIDNAGIQRELEIIKKKSKIQESLNDFYHTQLDRLKGKDIE